MNDLLQKTKSYPKNTYYFYKKNKILAENRDI